MSQEVLTWIPLLSLAVSIVAVAFSIRSSQIAARSLRFTAQQREDRDRSTTIYLIDAFLRRKGEKTVASFALTFSNLSDLGSSITRLDLLIWYVQPDQRLTALAFEAEKRLDNEEAKARKLAPINLPINIPARASISGWATFSFPRASVAGPIDRFTVVASTAFGQRIEVESYLVREIHNGEG